MWADAAERVLFGPDRQPGRRLVRVLQSQGVLFRRNARPNKFLACCVCTSLFWGSGSLWNVQSHLSLNHLSLQSGGEKLQVHLEFFKSLDCFRL